MHSNYLTERAGYNHPINNAHITKSQIPHRKIVNSSNRYMENSDGKWLPNTILITGDSMINQIDEKRLSNSVNGNIKVPAFPGANVEIMYNYIAPLLAKEPKVIVLHIGTNDAVVKSSDTILNEILKLKLHIESQLSDVNVIFIVPSYENR